MERSLRLWRDCNCTVVLAMHVQLMVSISCWSVLTFTSLAPSSEPCNSFVLPVAKPILQLHFPIPANMSVFYWLPCSLVCSVLRNVSACRSDKHSAVNARTMPSIRSVHREVVRSMAGRSDASFPYYRCAKHASRSSMLFVIHNFHAARIPALTRALCRFTGASHLLPRFAVSSKQRQ